MILLEMNFREGWMKFDLEDEYIDLEGIRFNNVVSVLTTIRRVAEVFPSQMTIGFKLTVS